MYEEKHLLALMWKIHNTHVDRAKFFAGDVQDAELDFIFSYHHFILIFNLKNSKLLVAVPLTGLTFSPFAEGGWYDSL